MFSEINPHSKSVLPVQLAKISILLRYHGMAFRHSTREWRVITPSGPLVIAQSDKTKMPKVLPEV
ncbi:MAG: hypothetical protein AUF67_01950 [Acidobacteria bacterium 13_1_20CM_58_21]|nr:MAG: hypothetical protein AUF67_01950 [Acidobacteria bacterium 13_1_20CM_58_21]